MNDKKIRKLVLAALLAALVCVATMVVQIPSPMQGYVNLGDCFVLLSGWLLGPWYGFAAGGIGLGAAMNMGAAMNQAIGNPLRKEERKRCVSCDALIPIDSRFCPQCGCSNSERVCSCGRTLAPGMKFCPECGKKV